MLTPPFVQTGILRAGLLCNGINMHNLCPVLWVLCALYAGYLDLCRVDNKSAVWW